MIIYRARPALNLLSTFRNSNQILITHATRSIHTGTLSNNKYIYHFPSPVSPGTHLLTLLPTTPPNTDLSIGSSSSLPPTPSTFTSNPAFLPILHSVLAKYATQDPVVYNLAQTYASETGFVSTSTRRGKSSSGAGPTAYQGGSGSGGRGGWVHVSDERRPPDWGRIADPEDIFGSVEVDQTGKFVGEGGNYQESGTYRIVTNDGM
jgi:hypothetical protein